MIYVRSKWWILANAYDQEGANYLSTMYLLELDQTNLTDVIAVHALRFEEFRPQKNWMPLVRDSDSLYFLYWMAPMTVLQLDFESMTVHKIYSHPVPFTFVLFGSTPAVTYKDDGWLFVVHDKYKVTPQAWIPTYLHRFLHIGFDFSIRGISPTFHFNPHNESLPKDVEFCPGLARDIENDNKLVLSFSVMESESWVATFDESDVMKVLVTPEELIQDKIPLHLTLF